MTNKVRSLIERVRSYAGRLGENIGMFLVMWLAVGTFVGTFLPSLVIGVTFGWDILWYAGLVSIASAILSFPGFALVCFLEPRQMTRDYFSDALVSFLVGGFSGGTIGSVLLAIAKAVAFVASANELYPKITPAMAVLYWVAPFALVIAITNAIFEFRSSLKYEARRLAEIGS